MFVMLLIFVYKKIVELKLSVLYIYTYVKIKLLYYFVINYTHYTSNLVCEKNRVLSFTAGGFTVGLFFNI